MRKILCSLFVINILLSFFVLYDFENNKINDNIYKSGEEQTFTLNVDKKINNINRDVAIDAFQRVAEKYKADLIFKAYQNAPGQKLNLTKYVFLKNSNILFENIKYNGKSLGDYDKSSSFLSTKKINSKNQIGNINILDSEIKFKISTFENLKLEKQILSGYYSVRIDKNKLDNFINDLKSQLQVDVKRDPGFQNSRVFIPPILKIVPMIIVFLLSILVVIYDFLSRYKNIGVKKLNGYSDAYLKWEYIRDIGFVYLIAAVLSYIVLFIIYFKVRNFLFLNLIGTSVIYTFIMLIILSLLLLIPLSYLDRIKISSVIKNKKPVELVKRFSAGFKVLFTGILIALFIFGLKLYVPVYNFYFENVKKWEDTINYAQVGLHYDRQDNDFDNMVWEVVQNKKLYVYANSKGGIQMLVKDFYDSQNPGTDKRKEENIIDSSIVVNNNYLKKNPIIDLKGKKIDLAENENINYILVPEKYAYLGNKIIYTYENHYYSLHYKNTEGLNDRLKEQAAFHSESTDYFNSGFDPIKVIIIKNGQGYFTYDINVHPETNNMVYDRIVEVRTNSSDLCDDITTHSGYFIKVSDPDEPFLSIADKVAELGLGAYYYDAYSSYGSVADFVNQTLEILNQIAVIFFVAGITISILIVYSIMIYMEKEKMDISVKLLNGYGFISRHGKKLLSTTLIYLIYIPAFYFTRGNGMETLALSILLIAILAFDLILSYIVIRIYEKRNIKDILKGN